MVLLPYNSTYKKYCLVLFCFHIYKQLKFSKIKQLIFLLLLTAIALMQYCSGNKETEQDASQSSIKGKFENFDVPYQANEFDVEKGKVLDFETGSKISIPANAFVYADGSPVKGKVKLDYREFHSRAEIIASGIPMTYEENGVTHHFESAGMFDIRAYQDGKPIFIADNKAITVDMASYKDGKFNFYYLSEGEAEEVAFNTAFMPLAHAQSQSQPRWQMLARDLDPSTNTARAEALDSLDELIPQAPAEPNEFNEKDLALDFELDISQFPELKPFEGIIWQYAGELGNEATDPNINEWIYEEEWSNITLESYKKRELKYKVTLSNNQKSFSTIISPALKGESLRKARRDFQNRLKEYERIRKEEAERIALLEAERKMQARKANFTRSFSIQKLGIYNHDILYKPSEPMVVQAKFKVQEDPSAKVPTVFIVMESGVIEYGANTFKDFKFSTTANNSLLALLPNDKVAVLDKDDFRRAYSQYKEGDEVVFPLRLVKEEIKSTAALEKLLESI